MSKLFVGGFPLDMNEMELVQLVAPHGEVKTIKIVRDKATKICKGYAFLEMATPEDARQSIEALDGTSLGPDRVLSVRPATEKAATPIKKPKVMGLPEKKKRPRRII
jgi:RNA recognition motif-containing protein